MGHGLSIWHTVYRYGYPSYRYGQPGYRYGIWANDMGDESTDMVISHIDMGYFVTLGLASSTSSPGLTIPDLRVVPQVEFESNV